MAAIQLFHRPMIATGPMRPQCFLRRDRIVEKRKLDVEKLNSWLTLGANIVVIAGIVLLALEINQNNELLSAQARMFGEQNRMRDEVAIMENAALRSVLIKKNRLEETTPEEELLYQVFQSTVLNGWQATWLEHRAGLIEIDGHVRRWRDLFWHQEYSDRWNDTKHRYHPDFIIWMDQNILSDPPAM